MKSIYKSIILTVVLLCLGSCTQNDGHIGDLFGSWALREMKCNGKELAELPRAVISFQNEIVRNTLYYGDREVKQTVGSWKQEGDIVYFNYTHSDDGSDGPGQGYYSAPTWLGFETNTITEARVSRLDGGHFNFSIKNSDGSEYSYKFDRTW